MEDCLSAVLADPSSATVAALAAAPPPPPTEAELAEQARVKSILDRFSKREVPDA